MQCDSAAVCQDSPGAGVGAGVWAKATTCRLTLASRTPVTNVTLTCPCRRAPRGSHRGHAPGSETQTQRSGGGQQAAAAGSGALVQGLRSLLAMRLSKPDLACAQREAPTNTHLAHKAGSDQIDLVRHAPVDDVVHVLLCQRGQVDDDAGEVHVLALAAFVVLQVACVCTVCVCTSVLDSM